MDQLLRDMLHLLHQEGVIEADTAIKKYAAPQDRDRIRIAATETGVVDWNDKYAAKAVVFLALLLILSRCDVLLCRHCQRRWQNSKADLGHGLVAFDAVANVLSHPRVDAALFWTTRWRYGGFGETNQAASAADALQVCLLGTVLA